ncbi:hypothetical protein HBI24_130090 [Parastagonospora nodorum]|nr:hypothetical protein HBI24_130090 [Parastagonospora nodorum]KAH6130067.1 hypothetical protein HBI64_113910 [Parastagonospora nodorum]
MTSPLIQPSYKRVDGRDSDHATETSTTTGLRLPPREQNLEDDMCNTKHTHLKRRSTQVPLQGPAALLSIALLTGAAVGVLLASRGSPIERWKLKNVNIQPQVWLSILSAIMDGLTMFALAKAAEITFWRRAARGTTLRSMYNLYEFQSILGALKNILCLRGDKLAAVSVLCLVSALRGPLFQRASMIDGNAMLNTTGSLGIKVAQLVPPNFLFQGSIGDRLLFDGVYDAYVERAPISIRVTGNEEACGDHCEGKVKGYGFKIWCSDVSFIPWDNSPNSTVIQMYQDPENQIGSAVPAFNSSAVLASGMDDSISNRSDNTDRNAKIATEHKGIFQVTNLFKSEPICGGDLSLRKCSLHHAVVEYDIALTNGTMSLRSENWQDDKVLFETPTWHLPTPPFPTIFDNPAYPWSPSEHWVSWYMAEFNEEISIYSEGDGGPFAGANIRLSLAKRFIDGDINNVSCSTTFRDPTQFVLNRLREIVFRTAVAAAAVADSVLLFGNAELAEQALSRTQNWTQNIDVIGQRHFVAYTMNTTYLVCAVIVSLLAVVAILPLYWDAKGDIVVLRSFNPLDVAHVFGAPILPDLNEADVRSYVQKEEGLKRVRCSVEQSESSEDVGLVRVMTKG